MHHSTATKQAVFVGYSRAFAGWGRRKFLTFVCGLLLSVLMANSHAYLANGQTAAPVLQLTVKYLNTFGLPPTLRPQANAMGSRLFAPGQERLVVVGVFTDQKGDHPAQLTSELSGKALLSLNGAKALGFDTGGVWMANGSTTPAAQEILESLTDDSAEAFLLGVANGGALRLLGQRFQTAATDAGNLLDIYTFLKPPNAASVVTGQFPKQFCFESTTHLLRRVRYQTSAQGPVVETLFDGWQTVNGQAAPSVWTRLENGKVVFTLRAKAISFASSANDSYFQKPH